VVTFVYMYMKKVLTTITRKWRR